MRRIIFAAVCFILLLSCTKDMVLTDFEKMAQPYIGTYELTEIDWRSQPVDMNGDTFAFNELYKEYWNMLGYNPANHFAQIRISSGLEVTNDKELQSLTLTSSLPIPHYVVEGEGYNVDRVNYLDLSFKILSISGFEHQSIYPKVTDPNDPFLSGIKEITICESSPDHFVIQMHCHLYYLDGSNDNLFYMFFTYKRLN